MKADDHWNKIKIILDKIKMEQSVIENYYRADQYSIYNEKAMQISELDTEIAQFHAEGKSCRTLDDKLKELVSELKATDIYKEINHKEKNLAELWREFNTLLICKIL